MSFQLQYRCSHCGHTQWSETRPSEWDCPCYIPEEPCDTSLKNPMGKSERKERYRIQYKLNGFTWLNKPPTMFYGPIIVNGEDVFPDRTHLKD